jgi:cytoskeletal protein RodZ
MDQNNNINSSPGTNSVSEPEPKKDPGVSVKFTDIAPQQKKYVAEMPQSRSSRKSSSNKWVVIVVIALVALTIIGLIWLFGRGGEEENDQDNQAQQQQTQETVEEEETEEVVEEVDVSIKESESGVEDVPTDSDFSTSTQSVGEEDVEDTVLGEMEQTGYEGFLRIVFTVDSDELPYTTAELVSQSNMIRLKFTGITEDNSGISVGKEASVTGSVVSTIIHDAVSEENTSRYSIGVTEDTGFYLHTLEDPMRIVLDIQEVAAEEEEEEEEEESEEESSSGENEFSKEAQSVSGDASGNVIVMNNVNYYDAPDEGVFRIVFTVGSLGSGSLPDASAEIVDYEGGKAVKLEISDMQQDFAAEGNYDVTYGNYGVEGMKGSFASNTSTYYIILKGGERDYKLYKRDAPAQIIVDVKR